LLRAGRAGCGDEGAHSRRRLGMDLGEVPGGMMLACSAEAR
jgi:hypothetical protein